MKQEKTAEEKSESVGRKLSFFEKYLSVWVAICIIAGVVLGRLVPAVPDTLGELEYAHVNVPIAVLIWFMIYPAMAEIDEMSVEIGTPE